MTDSACKPALRSALRAVIRSSRSPEQPATSANAQRDRGHLWNQPCGAPGSTQKTAADGRKPHQVAVALDQLGRPSITDLERLRSREKRPESRANTRPARFGRNDNCGFSVQATAARFRARCAWWPVADRFAPPAPFTLRPIKLRNPPGNSLFLQVARR